MYFDTNIDTFLILFDTVLQVFDTNLLKISTSFSSVKPYILANFRTKIVSVHLNKGTSNRRISKGDTNLEKHSILRRVKRRTRDKLD